MVEELAGFCFVERASLVACVCVLIVYSYEENKGSGGREALRGEPSPAQPSPAPESWLISCYYSVALSRVVSKSIC